MKKNIKGIKKNLESGRGETCLVLKKLFLAIEHGVRAVKKFSVTRFLTIDDLCTKKYFTLTDQVWMIMEELFNKRRLSLSKSRLIWNFRKTDNNI